MALGRMGWMDKEHGEVRRGMEMGVSRAVGEVHSNCMETKKQITSKARIKPSEIK